MRAARSVCWGFDLGDVRGAAVLLAHFNPRCVPEWSDAEIRRACGNAMRDNERPRGWLLNEPLPGGVPTRRSEVGPGAGATAAPHSPTYTAPDLGDVAEAVPVTTAADAAPAVPAPRPATPRSSAPPPGSDFTNFVTRNIENGGEVNIGLPLQAIADDLFARTGGWPKRVGSALFIPGVDHRPVWLDSTASLQAWIAAQVGETGGRVNWGRNTDMPSMAVFLSHLQTHAESYDDVHTLPHWPAIDRVCYLNPELPPADGGSLDELLTMFRPSTTADSFMLRAFFLTLFWGGRAGGRPAFLFEVDAGDGRGSGKSTVVFKAGDLLGSWLAFDMATTDGKDVMPRILSEEGRRSRMVLFDNVKGSRFSSSLIESAMTTPILSGRQLYSGEGSRPNYITWAVTSNQPALSKDLVQRCYPVRITPPVYSPEWNDEVNGYVRTHRWKIIADIIHELQGDPICRLADGEWGRWADWERDVMCRVCDPRMIAEAVADRRTGLDDDEATAQQVTDTLFEYIRSQRKVNPAKVRVYITAAALTDALKDLSPHGKNVIATPRWLKSINVPAVRWARRKSGRVWLWVGSETDDRTNPVEWEDLSY